jgi:uncharacterized membrane protein YeaQ/YmgE (transglycosylase-associated protein family)
MEILFAIVIAAAIGYIARYVVPGRQTYGTLITPAVGAVVTGAVWAVLVWLGFTFDGGWIWTISLVAGAIAVLLVAGLLPGARKRSDEALFQAARRA